MTIQIATAAARNEAIRLNELCAEAHEAADQYGFTKAERIVLWEMIMEYSDMITRYAEFVPANGLTKLCSAHDRASNYMSATIRSHRARRMFS